MASFLKWAENVLESVDQKAATTAVKITEKRSTSNNNTDRNNNNNNDYDYKKRDDAGSQSASSKLHGRQTIIEDDYVPPKPRPRPQYDLYKPSNHVYTANDVSAANLVSVRRSASTLTTVKKREQQPKTVVTPISVTNSNDIATNNNNNNDDDDDDRPMTTKEDGATNPTVADQQAQPRSDGEQNGKPADKTMADSVTNDNATSTATSSEIADEDQSIKDATPAAAEKKKKKQSPTRATTASTRTETPSAAAAAAAAASTTEAPEVANREQAEEEQQQQEEEEEEGEELFVDAAALLRENELLRKNMKELHEELEDLTRSYNTLHQRYQQAIAENERIQKLAAETKERLETQVDRLLKSKIQTDDEFASVLASKEAQQLALQRKLDEFVHGLKAKDHLISQLQEEKDQMVNEKARMTAAHAQAIQSLQNDLERLQSELAEEKESHASTRSKLEDTQKSLEQRITQLENECSELQRVAEQREDEIAQLESNLNAKDAECKFITKEYQDYKNRANKVLQSKEKLIADLNNRLNNSDTQTGDVGGGSGGGSDLNTSISSSDLAGESAQTQTRESEALIEEIERLRAENEEIQASLEALKRQQQAETTSSKLKIRHLENDLTKEKATVAKLQESMAALRLQLDEVRQQAETDKKQARESIREKMQEISNLEKKLSEKQNSMKQSDAEIRLRNMAEHLIQKQSQLETLNSEKAALALQLENALQRVKEAELLSKVTTIAPRNARNSRGVHLSHFYDPDEDLDLERGGGIMAGSEIPMKTNAFFSDLSRRGKAGKFIAKAMNAMDRMSIYTGRHLRRYPVLRVVFLCYIIVLHLWVLFVLFSGTSTLPMGPTDTVITPPGGAPLPNYSPTDVNIQL